VRERERRIPARKKRESKVTTTFHPLLFLLRARGTRCKTDAHPVSLESPRRITATCPEYLGVPRRRGDFSGGIIGSPDLDDFPAQHHPGNRHFRVTDEFQPRNGCSNPDQSGPSSKSSMTLLSLCLRLSSCRNTTGISSIRIALAPTLPPDSGTTRS